MKLLISLVTIIFFVLKIFTCKRLKLKLKSLRTKTRDAIIQIKYALGDSFVNIDSSHQFYDQGSLIKDLPVDVKTDYEDVFMTINDSNIVHRDEIIESFDLNIKRIKIYSRPFFGVFHELLMVCAFDETSEKEYYFVIDRGAKESDIRKTKVRIIYTGKFSKNQRQDRILKICDTKSPHWAEIRGVRKGIPDSTLLGEHPMDNLRIKSLRVLIDSVIHYAFMYPNYDLISTNCQHFATGFFNAVSWDEIERKSISNPFLSFRCNSRISHDDLLDDIIISKRMHK